MLLSKFLINGTKVCRLQNINLIRRQVVSVVKNEVHFKKENKYVGIWLLSCAGTAFATVLLGGMTRITKSGLSMVDWHFYKEFPPLSSSAWIREFEKYKNFPEFKLKNHDMTLNEFKKIWWMEYTHRMFGRTLGLMYFIPAGYFWYKKCFINIADKVRVSAIGGLIIFQGLLGWYMVKSGLNEKKVQNYPDPRVSHYRLAAHLGTAFITYSLLFWNGLSHILPPIPAPASSNMFTFYKMVHSIKGFVFLTVISGAFVAGIDAGLVYNSFPKMGDDWIPNDILKLKPMWRNFFENTTTVQFIHRLLGEISFAGIMLCWYYSKKLPLNNRMSKALNLLVLVGIIQVTLGISNLLLYVPKPLAISHQAGALTLLTSSLWLGHELKYIRLLRKIK